MPILRTIVGVFQFAGIMLGSLAYLAISFAVVVGAGLGLLYLGYRVINFVIK